MTAPSTEDVYCNPDEGDLIADPYPRFKRMHVRGTTTIQKETVS